MKVSLVVASGVHQGKAIPVAGPQFVIGRDPQCHLRPASQAISKQHCAVIIRDGKVYLKDLGSTNGTVLNETTLKGEEHPLQNNDVVKVGPLEFTARIEVPAARADATPFPETNPEAAAALAAVKAAEASKGVVRDPTPFPAAKPRPAAAAAPEAPAPKPAEAPAPAAETAGADDHDRYAAMLLGLDGEDDVPGGSTIVDVSVQSLGATLEQPKVLEDKPAEKKPAVREDTSNAASELLRRYMRRPK